MGTPPPPPTNPSIEKQYQQQQQQHGGYPQQQHGGGGGGHVGPAAPVSPDRSTPLLRQAGLSAREVSQVSKLEIDLFVGDFNFSFN